MHYSFKSTPTTTFKSRNQTITKSNQPSSIPGPNHYTVKKPLIKPATIAQTTQKRQLWNTINQGPGPGSYESISYITNGQKRSISAKLIRPPAKVPGPAAYQTNVVTTLSRAPVYSMGNKSKSVLKLIDDHNKYKPSPGLYEMKSSFNNSAGVIFGSSNRKDLTQTEKTPAPNYYLAQNSSLTFNRNPRCSLGSEKRQLNINVVENTPGPATYNKKTFLEENINAKKGFTCREKIRNLIAEEIAKFPAPGQYMSETLTFKHTAPRPATTSNKRLTFIDDTQKAKKDIPAFTRAETNFFNTSNHRASTSYNFGRSSRKALDQNQRTPGPAVYPNQKIQILHHQPAFSCPKMIPKNQYLKLVDPQNPGPGFYDPKLDLVKQSSVNAITLTQNRPGYQKQKQKPGVGQYNLLQDLKPKFGWNKEKRISFTDLKNEAKNGLHYNLNVNFTNPPSYMQVKPKLEFSPTKSSLASTGL